MKRTKHPLIGEPQHLVLFVRGEGEAGLKMPLAVIAHLLPQRGLQGTDPALLHPPRHQE